VSASGLDKRQVEFLLDGGPSAGLEARRAVIAADGSLPADVREDLLLLVTELVSNAVRHGGARPEQPARVTLGVRQDVVRMEVFDPGTHFSRADVSMTPGEGSGWGLVLVDRIAARWGISRAETGTCVWAEVPAG
jgi:anti-sigma regulatory factor (Ser/Thr protein kinase)